MIIVMKIVIIPSADLLYNSGSVIYAKILFEYLLNEGHDVCMIGACIPNDIDARYKEKIKVKKIFYLIRLWMTE